VLDLRLEPAPEEAVDVALRALRRHAGGDLLEHCDAVTAQVLDGAEEPRDHRQQVLARVEQLLDQEGHARRHGNADRLQLLQRQVEQWVAHGPAALSSRTIPRSFDPCRASACWRARGDGTAASARRTRW